MQASYFGAEVEMDPLAPLNAAAYGAPHLDRNSRLTRSLASNSTVTPSSSFNRGGPLRISTQERDRRKASLDRREKQLNDWTKECSQFVSCSQSAVIFLTELSFQLPSFSPSHLQRRRPSSAISLGSDSNFRLGPVSLSSMSPFILNAFDQSSFVYWSLPHLFGLSILSFLHLMRFSSSSVGV